MLRQSILLSALILVGCSGTGPTTSSTAASTPPATSDPPTTTTPPTTTAPPTTTPPPVTTPPTTTPPPPVTAPPPPVTVTATPQNITAWGNSQTQGYGLPDPSTQAWPVIMANALGWTADNQAVSGTTCQDLTDKGVSESLWDQKITATSVSAYGHFHNEEVMLGQDVGPARECIEAQTAWLSIPETNKVRGQACQQSGGWTGLINSAAEISVVPGAALNCSVTGSVVYVSGARVYGYSAAIYSVSIDGNPAQQYSQVLNEPFGTGPISAGFIRLVTTPGPHTVTFTCVDPGNYGCVLFYVAGVGGSTATVYSLSPVPNASWNTAQNFDPTTYASYYAAWKAIVSELQGDGLNIIPIDVNNTAVYDPNTQAQSDGIHETVAGHASIGNYAATLK